MENALTEILNTLVYNIDWVYAVVCNLATYMVISIFEGYGVVISTGMKRLVSAGVALVLGFVMVSFLQRPFEPVFYAFFMQFLIYDYFWKSILESLKKKIKNQQ